MNHTIKQMDKLRILRTRQDEAWAQAQAATQDDRDDLITVAQKLSRQADTLMSRIIKSA